jgi:LmbE family N-acetylglucosaminyl deacetylase
MLSLKLDLPRGAAPCVLLIGAHCDDIEIGCGGTVTQLLERYPRARIHYVVLSSGSQRSAEARNAARRMLRGAVRPRIITQEFRNSYFPAQLTEIKQFFEGLKRVKPNVVFTHYRDDLHQDHRIAGELTFNTFRDHVILEYEIPKYDGGLGSPSVFVPLTAATVKRKVALLMEEFPSQSDKQWFTPETFQALMRLRGIECNAPDGYAEAFYSRKIVL